MLEQRVLIGLLIVAISGGVVMYREVGEVKAMVLGIQDKIKDTDSGVRGEIVRLNGMIVNHERHRHGRAME